MKYTVEVTETGDVLGEFTTLVDAQGYATQMESIDTQEDSYTDGYYSIRNLANNELITF